MNSELYRSKISVIREAEEGPPTETEVRPGKVASQTRDYKVISWSKLALGLADVGRYHRQREPNPRAKAQKQEIAILAV